MQWLQLAIALVLKYELALLLMVVCSPDPAISETVIQIVTFAHHFAGIQLSRLQRHMDGWSSMNAQIMSSNGVYP